MSRQSSNRRPPCGQATADSGKIWFGGCSQQHNTEQQGIKVLQNITKVPDYASGSTGWIDPYSRAAQLGSPDCSPYNAGGCPSNPCYKCNTGPGSEGYELSNLYCELPTTADFQLCTGSKTSTLEVGPYTNCFLELDTTTSFDHCRNIGFKNVYAKKAWHGRVSPKSRTLLASDSFAWCCGCSVHNLDSTPPTTKYRTLEADYIYQVTHSIFNLIEETGSCETAGVCPDESTYSTCCVSREADHDDFYTRTATQTVSVDIYGNLSITNCSSGSSGYTSSGDFYAGEAFSQLGDCVRTIYDLASTYCTFVEDFSTIITSHTGADGVFSLRCEVTSDCPGPCIGDPVTPFTYNSYEVDLDLPGGTLSIRTYVLAATYPFCGGQCNYEVRLEGENRYIVTDTSYERRRTFQNQGGGLDQYEFERWHSVLSTPYTKDEVEEQKTYLMSLFPMDDNATYPWRTDENITLGPLVCFDEAEQAVTLNISSTCLNPSASYSGEIYGIPAPAGTDRVWIPNHHNWDICESLVQPGCIAKYLKSYGAWSTECGVPCATQMVNKFQGANMPQGAFSGMNFMEQAVNSCDIPSVLMDDVSWSCKYAEIIIPKQSYRYSRPCADDRFQVSSSQAKCITGNSGNEIYFGETIPFENGSKVWVCSVPAIEDGLYSASRDSDTQITLQSCVVSASNLPWNPLSNCGTGMVIPLRWKNMQPALCGTVDVVSLTGISPVTCSLSEETWLVSGDTVKISGSKGVEINGIWSVTMLNNTSMVLNGVTVPKNTYTSSTAYVSSLFAADPMWNDVGTKNDYTVLQWTYNQREVAEYYRMSASAVANENTTPCDGVTPCGGVTVPDQPRPNQAGCGMSQDITSAGCVTSCVQFNACRPSVAFFSPSGETFKSTGSYESAKNHGWVAASNDIQYGGITWQGVIKQSMDDPLWQAPPQPCSSGLTWSEDDGTCQEATITEDFYAHRPTFEARCEVPEGAPQIPGTTLGCATVEDFNNGCPSKPVCNPPYYNINGDYSRMYNPYPYATPWVLYQNQMNCACADGRFAPEYGRNGIVCSDTQVVPAP